MILCTGEPSYSLLDDFEVTLSCCLGLAQAGIIMPFHDHIYRLPPFSTFPAFYFIRFPPFTMSNVRFMLSVFSLSLVDPLYVIVGLRFDS